MKKRISAIFTALLLTLALCVPTLALNGLMEYVFDPDDLLPYEEWETLENKAAEITQRHDVGVYVAFVDDYSYYDYGTVYETTETLYYEEGLGVGDAQDGILLLVSQYTRDYALYTYGAAEQAFDIAELEYSFLSYLGDDNWYGGLDAYLVACDEALTRAETAVPEGPEAPEEPASPVRGVLTAVGGSCVVSLVICLVLKGKMKSVHHKSEARSYTANGGLQLTEKYDRYTHTTESVRRIEKKSSGGSSGGGGSGKF